MTFCAASKHLQTQRFLDTLRAYFIEVHRMMKDLHREANRRPNLVRRTLVALFLQLTVLCTGQTFVDHHAGIVDARTGHRIRSDSNGHVGDEEDNDAFRGGYGFFDAVSPPFSAAVLSPPLFSLREVCRAVADSVDILGRTGESLGSSTKEGNESCCAGNEDSDCRIINLAIDCTVLCSHALNLAFRSHKVFESRTKGTLSFRHEGGQRMTEEAVKSIKSRLACARRGCR